MFHWTQGNQCKNKWRNNGNQDRKTSARNWNLRYGRMHIIIETEKVSIDEINVYVEGKEITK